MEIVDVTSKFGNLFVKHKVSGETIDDKLEGFQWYFYCDKLSQKDEEKIRKFCRKIVPHQNLLKIYVENHDLNKWDFEKGKIDNKTIVLKYLLSKKIQSYEADFSLAKRWLLDSTNIICSNPIITYLDIETDDSHNGIEIGRDQILSFAFNTGGKSYFVCEDDEEKLLRKLVKLIKKSDIICTWNGENFDIPYILARCQLYGIQLWKNNIVHFDLMDIVKSRYKFSDQEPITNFNLENICQIYLKEGKVAHTESIKWLYDNDRTKLGAYNKQDVGLLYKLDTKLGIMEQVINVCTGSRTPYRNYYISETIDNYILQEAKALGRILPSNMWKLEQREGESDRKKFTGGFVLEPKIGLHENVSVFDFNSMYPNMIITFNIGIDTFLGKDIPEPTIPYIKTPNNCYFRSDIKSINAIVADKLLKERDIAKQEMKKYSKDTIEYKNWFNKSELAKLVNNGQFGIIGSTYTRYYSLDCSEAITLSAQYIIKLSNKLFTMNGYEIIANDTDSAFVKGL